MLKTLPPDMTSPASSRIAINATMLSKYWSSPTMKPKKVMIQLRTKQTAMTTSIPTAKCTIPRGVRPTPFVAPPKNTPPHGDENQADAEHADDDLTDLRQQGVGDDLVDREEEDGPGSHQQEQAEEEVE